MKFKKTMTTVVMAAVVGCGGLYASVASASTITCTNGAGQVGYSIAYPDFSVQARSNKNKTVKAAFYNHKGKKYEVATSKNGAHSKVYYYPLSNFGIKNRTDAGKAYVRCNP